MHAKRIRQRLFRSQRARSPAPRREKAPSPTPRNRINRTRKAINGIDRLYFHQFPPNEQERNPILAGPAGPRGPSSRGSRGAHRALLLHSSLPLAEPAIRSPDAWGPRLAPAARLDAGRSPVHAEGGARDARREMQRALPHSVE